MFEDCRIIVPLALAPLLLSCTPDALAGADPVDVVDAEVFAAEPTYADVAPIFAAKCVACHSSSGRAEDGVALDRYADVFLGRVENVCVAIHPSVGDEFQAAFVDEGGFAAT